MIQCFADLLTNWGLVDWKKYSKLKQEFNQDGEIMYVKSKTKTKTKNRALSISPFFLI
jgi:hypothetical protein